MSKTEEKAVPGVQATFFMNGSKLVKPQRNKQVTCFHLTNQGKCSGCHLLSARGKKKTTTAYIMQRNIIRMNKYNNVIIK